MKLKRILISQPKPETDKSPWFELPSKHKVTLDFKPFIHVEGVSASEFRKQKIDIAHYSCIILNSRNAVDHYFRIANELRFPVPEKTKYFCTTEAIALYLQKYIQYRKRKIFFAQQSIEELAEPIKKNRDEKFLFVCSDKATDKTTTYLESNKINFTQAIFYKTVSSDMKSTYVPGYDMIVFFSPNGIQSLFENYPDFKQGNIRIGVFGTTTYSAATLRGLRVDLAAPLPNAPSMTMALDMYIKEYNAKNGEVQPMVNFPSASTSVSVSGGTVKPSVEKASATAAPVKPVAKEKPVKAAPAKASKETKKPAAKAKPVTKPAAKKPVAKKAAPKKTAAKKAAPAKKAVPAKKATPAKKSAPAKKAAPKKAAPAKKKVAAKSAPKKAAPAKKKTVAKPVAKKKAPAKKKR